MYFDIDSRKQQKAMEKRRGEERNGEGRVVRDGEGVGEREGE